MGDVFGIVATEYLEHSSEGSTLLEEDRLTTLFLRLGSPIVRRAFLTLMTVICMKD
jgi:hypothetical protein